MLFWDLRPSRDCVPSRGSKNNDVKNEYLQRGVSVATEVVVNSPARDVSIFGGFVQLGGNMQAVEEKNLEESQQAKQTHRGTSDNSGEAAQCQ